MNQIDQLLQVTTVKWVNAKKISLKHNIYINFTEIILIIYKRHFKMFN